MHKKANPLLTNITAFAFPEEVVESDSDNFKKHRLISQATANSPTVIAIADNAAVVSRYSAFIESCRSKHNRYEMSAYEK